jgi:hypothetical protein
MRRFTERRAKRFRKSSVPAGHGAGRIASQLANLHANTEVRLSVVTQLSFKLDYTSAETHRGARRTAFATRQEDRCWGLFFLPTGLNAQLDPKAIIAVSAEETGDKIYPATSKELLRQGEFILHDQPRYGSYDHGQRTHVASRIRLWSCNR